MNSPRSTDLLPPIPTPRGHYWQLFRQTLMPSVVLLVVAITSMIVWRHVTQSASFTGEVETIQTVVSSPDNGLLTNLWVTTLQEVKAGDLVGEVMTTDPRTANTRLQVMPGQDGRIRRANLRPEAIIEAMLDAGACFGKTVRRISVASGELKAS